MTTAIGTIRMSYTMQPCADDDGVTPINGGWHYANADTIERAREWARAVVSKGRHCGWPIESVEIVGREMVLRSDAWAAVPGGRCEREVVRR